MGGRGRGRRLGGRGGGEGQSEREEGWSGLERSDTNIPERSESILPTRTFLLVASLLVLTHECYLPLVATLPAPPGQTSQRRTVPEPNSKPPNKPPPYTPPPLNKRTSSSRREVLNCPNTSSREYQKSRQRQTPTQSKHTTKPPTPPPTPVSTPVIPPQPRQPLIPPVPPPPQPPSPTIPPLRTRKVQHTTT